MRLGWISALLLVSAAFTGMVAAQESQAQPHVIVGIPDSGINPYHEEFYRPNLDEHPCNYIEDFPCQNVEKLDLSIDYAQQEGVTFEEVVEKDAAVWDSVEPFNLYWIPKTPFVAVMCDDYTGTAISPASDTCILDDGTDHGTGTTSSVIRENPDALIAFKQGSSSIEPLQDRDIPVDIYSVSWGTVVPIPLPQSVPSQPIYVKSAGNDPRPVPSDGWSGNPKVISVGGAYPERGIISGPQDEPMAGKSPDVVSWYCRDVAAAGTLDGTRVACGTSFSGPTVAGGLSKVVLDVRTHTGYTGTITDDGMVNPDIGITTHDVRDAMNRTATYDPDQRLADESIGGVPLISQAPWVQWGWGWYDARRAHETVDHLLDIDDYPAKSLQAQLYMGSVHTARDTLY